MFSQIAQVFSSSGVVLPGSEGIPAYRKAKTAEPCDHKGDCSCFSPKFDQASAKLELSQTGRGQAARPGPKKADGKPLNEDEKKEVEALAKRDREVKAHEAAHQASAAGFARGGASFEYKSGPDGKQYAVGGHVNIDAGPIQGNPRATLMKSQVVQRAALAPADPSGADRAVAAAAAQMAIQAQKELSENPEGKTEAGPQGVPDKGQRSLGSRSMRAQDPRHAYAQRPSRTGAALSVYA
ncbi:MAG: putative metalloprotease CJM1_0395 family protein [Fibrobacteria bacterium]